MYQKNKKKILQKMCPPLSQLDVAMAHRNYFRQNNSVNPQIGNKYKD